MRISIFLLFLALLIPALIHAQAKPFEDHTNEIAASESKSGRFRPPHENKGNSNTDIFYTRFEWEIDPEILFIRGNVTSYFKAVQTDVSIVKLELNNNMVIDSIIFRSQKIGHEYYSDFEFGAILPAPVLNGESDSLKIFYHGIPQQGSGFGSFVQDEHDSAPIIWTLSEPYGAKDWWPGKNDLTDKIDSIDVIVNTPKANRVASNGLLVSETAQGEYKTFHWKHRYPIASYLVAFAVTNYSQFTNYAILDGDSLPILEYVFPEDSASIFTETSNTKEMIQLFDTLFGPYPFRDEKYGHAQFSWGGGMEHQTMSFVSNYSHDLRAHELAHSWFGNKITLATWHDIFLNEGFATYSTGLSYEHMYNGFWWNIWKNNTKNAVLSAPDGSVYVEDTTDINRLFSARLSYHKGAYLLHMLRWILGDEAYFTAIKNYLNDPMLAYRFATLADFKSHLETAGSKDLTEFFEDWYYGEGYPIYGINVAQMEEDGKIHATIFQEQSHPSVSYFEMPVPITIYGEGAEKTLVCDNTFSGQEYVFDNPGFVMDSVVFDKDQWLLAKIDFLNLGVENKTLNPIAIYPNPASESISFFIPDQRIQKIQVFDLSGKVVFDEVVNLMNEKVEINVAVISNGFYLLTAKTLTGSYHGKFVKK